MKHLNKLFSLGLVAISTSPIVASLNTNNINTSLASNKVVNVNDTRDESRLRCTVTYVGKNCTSNKQAIVARCVDQTPRAANCLLKRYEHNELANTTLKSVNGFEYTLPSETYAYICSPDATKTDPKGEQNQFQNNGINEMGVGVSCTLTCFANDIAESFDKFTEAGLGEEMLNQVITPQAFSAKKAMMIAADALDKHGASEPNIILAIDQNEAWLMEIYTGHQYCAIKLPDDKVCIAGNEFILNTLDELGISDVNNEDCIVSPKLLSLAKDNNFAKFDDSGKQDVYHLDLFNTYSRPLAWIDEQTGLEVDTDYSHMRTWRGYSLFDPSGTVAQSYGYKTKYAPFLTPKNKDGVVRTDVSVADVISVYRDEYDELIGKEGFERFTQAKINGTLRAIADETTRSIHIMTVNPNLPKAIAVNEWYCPDSGNYAPFVMLNNGITSIDGQYAYTPERYSYDEYCSAVLYRKLNSLAWGQREKYGFPLQQLWSTYEVIYSTQMEQVIEDASNLSISDAQQVITNFDKHIRDVYIEAVKNTIEDLTWHDMDQSHYATKKEFVPLIDIQQYLTNLGWTDFNWQDKTLTFKYGNDIGKLDINEGYIHEKGKLSINDNQSDIDVIYRNNKAFVGLNDLNKAIEGRINFIKIDINDYLNKVNNLVWILPIAIGIPLIAICIIVPIIFKKKNKKTVSK